jgi:hypothetical protein
MLKPADVRTLVDVRAESNPDDCHRAHIADGLGG